MNEFAQLREAAAEHVERLKSALAEGSMTGTVFAGIRDLTVVLATYTALLARLEAAERDAVRLRETLKGIAEANYREWDEGVNTPFAFVDWAKSRAAHALTTQEQE